MATCQNSHLEKAVADRFGKNSRHFSWPLVICVSVASFIWLVTLLLILTQVLLGFTLIIASCLAAVIVWYGCRLRFKARLIDGHEFVSFFLDQDGEGHWTFGGGCCQSVRKVTTGRLCINVASGRCHKLESPYKPSWTVTDIVVVSGALRACLEDEHEHPLPPLPLARALQAIRQHDAATLYNFLLENYRTGREKVQSARQAEHVAFIRLSEALQLLRDIHDRQTDRIQPAQWQAIRTRIARFFQRLGKDSQMPEAFRIRWIGQQSFSKVLTPSPSD